MAAGGAKPRGRAKPPADAGGASSPRTGSPAGMRSLSRGPPTSTPRKELKDKDGKPELLAEQPWQTRWRSFKTRTGSTLALLAIFIAILRAGHVFVCALVFAIQVRPAALRRVAPRARALRHAIDRPAARACRTRASRAARPRVQPHGRPHASSLSRRAARALTPVARRRPW